MISQIPLRFVLESLVAEWFEENFRSVGFDSIRKVRTPGDYIVTRNGKSLVVEVESQTTHFMIHKKLVRDKIDVIVCYYQTWNPFSWSLNEIADKEIINVGELMEPFLLEYFRPWIVYQEKLQKIADDDYQKQVDSS